MWCASLLVSFRLSPPFVARFLLFWSNASLLISLSLFIWAAWSRGLCAGKKLMFVSIVKIRRDVMLLRGGSLSTWCFFWVTAGTRNIMFAFIHTQRHRLVNFYISWECLAEIWVQDVDGKLTTDNRWEFIFAISFWWFIFGPTGVNFWGVSCIYEGYYRTPSFIYLITIISVSIIGEWL